MDEMQLIQILEAAILAAGAPLPLTQMEQLFEEDETPPTRAAIQAALATIEAGCETRGVELRELASGYQFRAKQCYSGWLKKLWEERPARYSRALMETLALIVYKQPITRGEIEAIRGVAVGSQLIKTLLEREWIHVVGHKDVPGRPALYASTPALLDYFNLKTLSELPNLAEIRDLSDVEKVLPEQLDLVINQEMTHE